MSNPTAADEQLLSVRNLSKAFRVPGSKNKLRALDVPVRWIRGNGERELAEALVSHPLVGDLPAAALGPWPRDYPAGVRGEPIRDEIAGFLDEQYGRRGGFSLRVCPRHAAGFWRRTNWPSPTTRDSHSRSKKLSRSSLPLIRIYWCQDGRKGQERPCRGLLQLRTRHRSRLLRERI